MSKKIKHEFGSTPEVYYSRSKIHMPKRVKTSCNLGDLVPLGAPIEVLPGDTFAGKMNVVVRTSSQLVRPLMDNMHVEVRHFFVPLRLVYEDYDNVFGDTSPTAYSEPEYSSLPTLYSTNNTAQNAVYVGSVADHMGLPLGLLPNNEISVLPFRAFALIRENWYRNQNTTNETYISKGDSTTLEILNNSAWSESNYTGMLPKVSKSKDYFTSCLPAPQKGLPVMLPLGVEAPVTTVPDLHQMGQVGSTMIPLKLGVAANGFPSSARRLYTDSDGTVNSGSADTANVSGQAFSAYYSNLVTDLSSATAISINDLRTAFQMQRYLEKGALYGERINEYYLSHFHVQNPDLRIQRSEYLGGGSFPVTIQQVIGTNQRETDADVSTSENKANSDLGSVGAYSLSNGQTKFVKSFTEHGYLFTCLCIRQDHSYNQGVAPLWRRKVREDFYDPVFAHLGNQPVYTSQLYVGSINNYSTRPSTLKGNIFGYQEAWAEYRYLPSESTGQMRSYPVNPAAPWGATVNGQGQLWTLGDWYANAPTLTESFDNETHKNLDRVLTVASTVQDQFIIDTYFDLTAVRVMPVYSVPGLIDHDTTRL